MITYSNGIWSDFAGDIAMSAARAMQVSRPGGPFELVDRAIPPPGPRQVRVKVQACGLCHSDSLTKKGPLPGIRDPRVPRHEIARPVEAPRTQVPPVNPPQPPYTLCLAT